MKCTTYISIGTITQIICYMEMQVEIFYISMNASFVYRQGQHKGLSLIRSEINRVRWFYSYMLLDFLQ